MEWKPKIVKVSDLKDWDRNPRKISEDDYKYLLESIKKYGFHDVLKINTDNVIISGHQRKRILQELGIDEVVVLCPDRELTETEKEVVAVSSNFHNGQFDYNKLSNEFELEPLKEIGFDPVSFELDDDTDEEPKPKQVKPVECPNCHQTIYI